MERTVACTFCGLPVSSLLDQVLDLPAFTICQCRCGEIAIVVKKPTDSGRRGRAA
jgi:hypothetical protein